MLNAVEKGGKKGRTEVMNDRHVETRRVFQLRGKPGRKIAAAFFLVSLEM